MPCLRYRRSGEPSIEPNVPVCSGRNLGVISTPAQPADKELKPSLPVPSPPWAVHLARSRFEAAVGEAMRRDSKKVEADVEVNDRGELVVSAAELGELAVPGQRLHVTVSPPAPRGPRRSMRGMLAGKALFSFALPRSTSFSFALVKLASVRSTSTTLTTRLLDNRMASPSDRMVRAVSAIPGGKLLQGHGLVQPGTRKEFLVEHRVFSVSREHDG